jgi:predicted NBD/HSP70 family sugar kinase
MNQEFTLVTPKIIPVLDPDFKPAVLSDREFLRQVDASGYAVPCLIAVERDRGRISRFDTRVFDMRHPKAAANFFYIERVVKFLLWQFGGWKVTIHAPECLVQYLRSCYSETGCRAFDAQFWGDYTYEHTMTFVYAPTPSDMPQASTDSGAAVKFEWKGWRIGFDLGASDEKVAVVKDGKLALKDDGEPLLSAEYVWDPKPQTDISYHHDKINFILKEAEKAIKSVDQQATVAGIGGSSAGVFVDGRARNVSLFRGITPRERFDREAAPLFKQIQKEWGIPLRLENDGDVTALAGAISLNDGAVLGIAMGSSLAAGYVSDDMSIKGWMNELAFAPVDYNPHAAMDEWSHDIGVGANYFSQQAVGRLIDAAGIEMDDIPVGALPLRLKRVQALMEAGDERARKIYQTIGVYFGYTIALYCSYYPAIRHLEVLGRVMTGEGGKIILEEARKVLQSEFPEYADIEFYEPSEREKRHGQAAAAAFLPEC